MAVPMKRMFVSSQSVVEADSDGVLSDIDQVVHRLKCIAQDMNDQLNGQNCTLKHIHQHTLTSTDQIRQQITDIRRMC